MPWRRQTSFPLQIANAVPALVTYVDKDRRYRFVNAAFERWFGYAPGDVAGRSVEEVLGPEPYRVAQPHIDAALAGAESGFTTVVRHRDGGLRRIEARYVPHRDDDGEVVGYYGLILDRTEGEWQARWLAEERNQRILLALSDTLAALQEPAEMAARACAALAEALGADRVGYAEYAPGRERLTVLSDWSGRLPSITGWTAASDLQPPDPGERTHAFDSVAGESKLGEAQRGALRVLGVASAVHAVAGRTPALLFVHMATPREWAAAEVGLVEAVAERTAAAVERARAEGALRESEARFRAMADSAPAPVWVTSAEGPVLFVNRAFEEFAGQPAETLLGDAWIGLIHPEDVQGVGEIRREARRTLAPYIFEARFRGGDGEYRWMQASSRPRFDGAGAFQGYVGMAVDVTESRRLEAHQRLLINELNHRVKNTLASVQSIAAQTLRDGVPLADGRARLNARLAALSAVHNVLTRESWAGAGVVDVIDEAIRPYDDPERARFACAGPPVRLGPRTTLALSMALHELATNAVKHGALSAPGGRVDVAWTVEDERLTLEWRERAGPAVSPPGRRGFGTRLLAQGLAMEFGRPAELRFEPTGLVCTIRAGIGA